jgi:hypothetical protein
MQLQVMLGTFAIYRLPPDATVPPCVFGQPFFSVTKTIDELSIVAPVDILAEFPYQPKVEQSYKALKVEGPLDFALTGILAQLTQPLVMAKIPVFVLSTFDTDYLFLKTDVFDQGLMVLKEHNHIINQTS